MWTFIKSASNKTNWLKGHAKEVCFIGRSNVGKSSLINALAKTKIARTSNTPGRTQLVNFFKEGDMFFVDLPGYGYARMSKKSKDTMVDMIEEYITERMELVRTFVLVDSKIGPTRDDIGMINFLKESGMNFMVVMTKSDKPTQSELHKTTKMLQEITPDYIVVSAKKRKNIEKLGKIIKTSF